MKRFVYKKVIGFTEQQQKAFNTLEEHNVNVNQFIRQAIKEKLKKEWKDWQNKANKLNVN